MWFLTKIGIFAPVRCVVLLYVKLKRKSCDVSSNIDDKMMQIFDEASSDASWKAWESPPKKRD